MSFEPFSFSIAMTADQLSDARHMLEIPTGQTSGTLNGGDGSVNWMQAPDGIECTVTDVHGAGRFASQGMIVSHIREMLGL